jgi:anthranilate phosphoribosyltransferase
MLIKEFLQESIAGNITRDAQIEYLTEKHEYDAQELADAVTFLYSQRSKVATVDSSYLDVCGTGGSGLPRINTSTLSAYLLSRKGIKVAKHGNKAASGRCGSFDLLERIIEDYPPAKNLQFLNAREYYPIMAQFAQVRKLVNGPTFFNIMGPLLSPNQAKYQIIGTSFEDKMMLIAQTSKLLGREKVMVVRGSDGLDEVTLTGQSKIVELNSGEISEYEIEPNDFGVKDCDFEEIAGGDVDLNLRIAKSMLDGKCKTKHLELVQVNAALALKLLGVTDDLLKAYHLIASGNILDVIVATDNRSFRVDSNISKSDRSFKESLLSKRKSLILEVKMASPTETDILSPEVSIESIVKKYEYLGAKAISVVTEPNYFNGSFDLLSEVRSFTNLPVLCKDFIVCAEHITAARKAGADAVLLIAKLLSRRQISQFIDVAKSYNMDALCEVHNLEELNMVIAAGADIIGVNNRDLYTFVLDLKTTNDLANYVPENCVFISESGIRSVQDIRSMPSSVNSFLVGTNVLKSNFIDLKIKELNNEPIVKICGIRTFEEAEYCENLGVEMIGLNFVNSSKRKINIEEAEKISSLEIIKVGVFQNQSIEFVNKTSNDLGLDMIQLSGHEDQEFIYKCCRPVIKTVYDSDEHFNCELMILDGRNPGSGEIVDTTNFKLKPNTFIAGGLDHDNVQDAIVQSGAIGADCASGIETEASVDLGKIELFFNNAKNAYSNEH